MMTTSQANPSARRTISPRTRTGWISGAVMALLFGVVVTAVVGADFAISRWLWTPTAGAPSAITLRVTRSEGAPLANTILVARGEVVEGAHLRALATQPSRTRGGVTSLVGWLALLCGLAGLYIAFLRRSLYGRVRRVVAVNLAVVAGTAIVMKLVLLTTTVSLLIVPIALLPIIPTLVFDRTVGLATGAIGVIVLAALVPPDPSLLAVLSAQVGVGAVMASRGHGQLMRRALIAVAFACVAAVVAYVLSTVISGANAPWAELASPLSSALVAIVGAGLIGLGLVSFWLPAYQRACHELSHARLVALEDLSNPQLRQIAARSPGTWQHSLAMANMAELAANHIGANGRLTRVGAYYHDLGKSLAPKYFIENLESGESNPHDQLPPEASRDAIFAHVLDGVAQARRDGLPSRIIDFMHMHHGDGVLEFFWNKCQELGNPNKLTIDDFRYPGVRPQTRETAILTICDAVEAASRTLRKTDDATVRALVQRIVYGKLQLGQLDESGLTMHDLRLISESLAATLKHAHHGRIEYPWQRAAADAEAAATRTPPGRDHKPAFDETVPSGSLPATGAEVVNTPTAETHVGHSKAPSLGVVAAQSGLTTTGLANLSRARTVPASAEDAAPKVGAAANTAVVPTQAITTSPIATVDTSAEQPNELAMLPSPSTAAVEEAAAISEPEISEPEISEPEISEPELLEPAIIEREISSPTLIEPAFVAPTLIDPELVEPAIIEPAVIEPSEPIVRLGSQERAPRPRTISDLGIDEELFSVPPSYIANVQDSDPVLLKVRSNTHTDGKSPPRPPASTSMAERIAVALEADAARDRTVIRAPDVGDLVASRNEASDEKTRPGIAVSRASTGSGVRRRPPPPPGSRARTNSDISGSVDEPVRPSSPRTKPT